MRIRVLHHLAHMTYKQTCVGPQQYLFSFFADCSGPENGSLVFSTTVLSLRADLTRAKPRAIETAQPPRGREREEDRGEGRRQGRRSSSKGGKTAVGEKRGNARGNHLSSETQLTAGCVLSRGCAELACWWRAQAACAWAIVEVIPNCCENNVEVRGTKKHRARSNLYFLYLFDEAKKHASCHILLVWRADHYHNWVPGSPFNAFPSHPSCSSVYLSSVVRVRKQT